MEFPQALEFILKQFLDQFIISSWTVNSKGKSASVKIRFNVEPDKDSFDSKSLIFMKMSPSYQKRLKRRSEQRMNCADETESMSSTFYCKEYMLHYNELLEVSYIDDPQHLNTVAQGEGQAYYHDYESTATASMQIVEQYDYAICNTQPMQRIYDN